MARMTRLENAVYPEYSSDELALCRQDIENFIRAYKNEIASGIDPIK